MIYLLYGSDTEKSRQKLHTLIDGLVAKRPDAAHIRVTDESFNEAELSELVGSMGLFVSKAIVEMNMVFRNDDAKDVILKNLKEIAASENIFVFLEGELNKAEWTKFEKYAEKMQESAVAESSAKIKKDFNIFSLTDALAGRDRKRLWVLYQKALREDKQPEEIHGLLFWQAKALWLARDSKSPADAGLNPFVYKKSQSALAHFPTGDLEKMTNRLVTLYHEARRGKYELQDGLEQFILTL
jgi:DNA polymerase III delta subunit